MKTKWLAVAMVVGLALIQGAAYAETLTGKIVSVDANAMRLVINEKMHTSGKIVEKAFSVTPKTALHGFASLGDLKPGQKVQIKAEANPKAHGEEALSISLDSAKSSASQASSSKSASSPRAY